MDEVPSIEFFAKVRVRSSDPEKAAIDGCLGYIAGKTEWPMEDGRYGYGVFIYQLARMWSCCEGELEVVGGLDEEARRISEEHGLRLAAKWPEQMGRSSKMTAVEAFSKVVRAAVEPGKARRFIELARTAKRQSKLLDALAHQFEAGIRASAVMEEVPAAKRKAGCFVFLAGREFGEAFASFEEAYEALAIEDSWLIVLADGTVGVHRPEGRWDAEKVFGGG